MSAFGSTENIESLSERRELSEAAKALLADKAFAYAFLKLRQTWFAQLMEQPHSGAAQDELAARLRALDAIPNELSLIIAGYRHDLAQRQRHA